MRKGGWYQRIEFRFRQGQHAGKRTLDVGFKNAEFMVFEVNDEPAGGICRQKPAELTDIFPRCPSVDDIRSAALTKNGRISQAFVER